MAGNWAQLFKAGGEMGKQARIQELEQEIAILRQQRTIPEAALDFIRTLAEMPEDAVIMYTLSGGQSIQCEVGRAAKILMEKLNERSD
jgi:thioredoxin-like negative regulator of GroEL